MLIVPSLLFTISFLAQVAVFAAPLPLNDLSINALGDHEFANDGHVEVGPVKSGPRRANSLPGT